VPESQTEKSLIAKDILQGLKAENSTSLLHLVDGYQILCQAYIQLASVDASKLSLDKKRRVRFSALQGPARLDQCLGKGSRRRPFPPCILTATPLLQPGCDYTEPESIVGFEDSFTITESGLTRPKVVVCLSSKGRRYRQLVKGGDDCRGDSVMEQVFLYVNELFRFQSKLNQPVSSTICNIATYNIVPLDEKTGVSVCGVESSEAAL
jgi:ataxia telangiectasia mutated family protein